MKKQKFRDFFNETEMGFYKNLDDLGNKIEKLLMFPKKINKYAKNGKKKYFKFLIIKKYQKHIIDKTFI